MLLDREEEEEEAGAADTEAEGRETVGGAEERRRLGCPGEPQGEGEVGGAGETGALVVGDVHGATSASMLILSELFVYEKTSALKGKKSGATAAGQRRRRDRVLRVQDLEISTQDKRYNSFFFLLLNDMM